MSFHFLLLRIKIGSTVSVGSTAAASVVSVVYDTCRNNRLCPENFLEGMWLIHQPDCLKWRFILIRCFLFLKK